MLNVVILAAGQGKRMQSDLPKVLHPIAGQPMLTHVLQTAYRLKPDRIMVVVGHGEAEIRSRFADDVGIVFVQQKQQLGTGHAVQQALASPEAALSDEGATLVLYGDVPLIQADTLRNLLDKRGTGVALL
ncbi:MAG TPA: NTP transferase domain-containing protein, partial [Burkholderiaceae bacterium]|nr:NTP transferase domain-containing protein [Burkholderiaceae bacterium]